MTQELKNELERIAGTNSFHSKVAVTCLSTGRISVKQADILNQVSEIEIEFSVDIDNLKADQKFEDMQEMSRKLQRGLTW